MKIPAPHIQRCKPWAEVVQAFGDEVADARGFDAQHDSATGHLPGGPGMLMNRLL